MTYDAPADRPSAHVLALYDAVRIGGGRLTLWRVGGAGAVLYARCPAGNNRRVQACVGESAPVPGLPARVELLAVRPTAFDGWGFACVWVEPQVWFAPANPLRSPLFDRYPAGWPQCHWCDLPALDGHLTCGSERCPEQLARDFAEPSAHDPTDRSARILRTA